MTTESAFVTSIVTSAIISLILYGVFRFLYCNSSYAAIFFPSRIKRGEPVPSPTFLGVFDWLRDVFVVKGDELVARAGLDAAIYIRFLYTCECAFSSAYSTHSSPEFLSSLFGEQVSAQSGVWIQISGVEGNVHAAVWQVQ